MIDYDIEIDDIIDVLHDNNIPGLAYCGYEFIDGVRHIVITMTPGTITESWRKEIKRVCSEFGEHYIMFEEL